MFYSLRTSDGVKIDFDDIDEGVEILKNIMEYELHRLTLDYDCCRCDSGMKMFIMGRERNMFMIHDRILFEGYILENDETKIDDNSCETFDERPWETPWITFGNGNDPTPWMKLDERLFGSKED